MAGNRKVSLEAWIADALTDPDKSEPCSMLSLQHIASSVPKEIHSVRMGGSGPPRSSVELAGLFMGKANVYAQDLNGVQQFEMWAFYGPKQEPQAYYPFKISGIQSLVQTSSVLETEAPDGKGLTIAAMRHAEVATQLGMRAVGMAMDTLAGQISGLLDQNRTLMAENADGFVIIRKMLMEQMEQQKADRVAELAALESSNMKAAAMRFIPALVNTVVGKNVFPQSSADTALIETLASHVTPDHMALLAEVLPPTVAGPLLARFSQLQEAEQQAQINGNVEEELGQLGEGNGR